MQANEADLDFIAEAQRLEQALREAGAIALRISGGNIRSWTKAHNSPVSEADIEVDRMLRERLASPGIGWLSEESEDDLSRLGSRRLHVVDPIDGTRAYISGGHDWSISAALVENGRPVAAAVYAPATSEMFLASAGSGTRLNGQPVSVTRGDTLQGARVAGPKGYLDRLTELKVGITCEPKIHSLALRLARVAQGRIDVGLASIRANDWDLAAADLLVHEAGGVLTDASGKTLVYNLHDPSHGALIAAGIDRHKTVLGLVRGRRQIFT